jgi:hypothetical protein
VRGRQADDAHFSLWYIIQFVVKTGRSAKLLLEKLGIGFWLEVSKVVA